MNCSGHQEVLSALLDGEASPEEVRLSAQHLADCDDCTSYKQALLAIREELQEWPEETPAVGSSQPATRGAPPWRLLGAAAALAFAFGLGFVSGRGSPAVPKLAAQPRAGFYETRWVVYPENNELHSQVVLTGADPALIRVP